MRCILSGTVFFHWVGPWRVRIAAWLWCDVWVSTKSGQPLPQNCCFIFIEYVRLRFVLLRLLSLCARVPKGTPIITMWRGEKLCPQWSSVQATSGFYGISVKQVPGGLGIGSATAAQHCLTAASTAIRAPLTKQFPLHQPQVLMNRLIVTAQSCGVIYRDAAIMFFMCQGFRQSILLRRKQPRTSQRRRSGA